jgi:hypothetical protein
MFVRLVPNVSRVVVAALLCFTVLGVPSVGRAQTLTSSSKPQLVANGRRYLETGLKPATGRSGSASMTARALVGKDGTTTVEMTTGALDNDSAPPGNINKAQLKPLDEDGEALYARNYTGLSGGYFQTTVNDLHRGQQLQVQATVDGIDANRANVVTLVETVKVRPDLSPTDLSFPSRGVAGSPVNISVVARELKGDVGATANLVLYADGVEVDRASGVWIDAGGTVSCVFTHTFSSAGTKQLSVKTEGARPGDYDVSNDTVVGSIEIGQVSGSELNYNVQVVDVDDDYQSHLHEKRYLNGILQSERDENFSTNGWRQSVNFYGWTGRMVSFPLNVSHQETNDGDPVVGTSYANLTPTSVIDSTNGTTRFISSNVWRYDSTTGYYFNLYTNASVNLSTGARTETTFFSSNRQAGDVTYYSSGYEQFWDAYSGKDFFYSWNTTEVSRAGTRIPLGTRYGINLSMTGGDGATYVASPEVTLTSFDNSAQQPSTCFDWAFGDQSGTSCFAYERVQTGKHGYVYKGTNP